MIMFEGMDGIYYSLFAALVGLITAIITSLLNMKVFRAELAESQIFEDQIKRYQILWEEVTKINHEAILLFSNTNPLITQMQRDGIEEKEILRRINIEYISKGNVILESTGLLQKYYILLPSPIIESLKQYETLIYDIFIEEKNDKRSELLDVYNNLFNSINTTTAKIIIRELTVSKSINDLPKGGIIPEYIKDRIKNLNFSYKK